jgi:hypothetical protein
MPSEGSTSVDLFLACATAMQNGVLVERVSASDKEFHFQNWVRDRLGETEHHFDAPGRNSYPDFRIVEAPDGYEVKGLQWPGREADYDCNSRVPSGHHNGRTVFYVFGRYPKPDGSAEYPVVDLVVCHGDFLNADREYLHENKSFRGFGSYGDLLVRDRKMYVAPTPFALTEGTTGKATLITPENMDGDDRLERVGTLVRRETEQVVTGYTFNLQTNELRPNLAPNPSAGTEHEFGAYRVRGVGTGAVEMRTKDGALVVEVEDEE